MPLSMHQATVPVLIRGLTVLSALLDKGASHAAGQGIDPASLVMARLAPDMLPLSGQVQRASDTAKFAAARLTGGASPSFADEETTFDELKARCAKTVDYLGTMGPAAFEGSEDRMIGFGGREPRWTLPGTAYLLSFALPNFFFHVTTAYDILRQAGVPVGKSDYLGSYDQG